ncbi:MAG TPA: succinate dehydrogenase, cytochrome b556 subunit [Deinococcales bacterium]|nr:succinate dehydrogenase, cytochrome b556 subunit [Deinococcales bacterium]
MYRGREGQWSFYLHRLSGWAIMIYLLMHTVSIGSVMLGREVYMAIHETYGFILFRLGLVGVAAGVAFHSFNGIRIIIMDFTRWGVKVQNQLFYIVLALTLAATAVTLWFNVPRILGGGH